MPKTMQAAVATAVAPLEDINALFAHMHGGGSGWRMADGGWRMAIDMALG